MSMQLFDTFTDKQRFEEFYADLCNHILFDTPIRFMAKYPEITNYNQIINSRNALETVLGDFASADPQDDEQLNQFLMRYSESIKTDVLKAIRKVLKLKTNQIKRTMLEKCIALNNAVLVNFNWKVSMIVSHSRNTLCKTPICSVELIIKDKSLAQEKRIVIEQTREELENLIAKLKKMQVALK